MIHTCANHVFGESKWGFTCIWGLSLLGSACAGWQMMGEQSVHLGGLQRLVREYAIEQQCHLWLETTAYHPWALVWCPLAFRGTLSWCRQLWLSAPLMSCLRQVISERRRQRVPSAVAKQQDRMRCGLGHIAVASLIKVEKKKLVLSLLKFLQTMFMGHNAISVTPPWGLKLHTFSFWGRRKIEEGGVWSNNSSLAWH